MRDALVVAAQTLLPTAQSFAAAQLIDEAIDFFERGIAMRADADAAGATADDDFLRLETPPNGIRVLARKIESENAGAVVGVRHHTLPAVPVRPGPAGDADPLFRPG